MPAKRALIVDDSTTAQYRLKKMLRPYGLHIDVMDSGEAALRYLATNEPDVIFMDHLMPGMDGFRALQIIKSHPETAMIPVIMYTSKSGDVYTGQARALGALDVVNKDTINAMDLSKVLEAIHIYRQEASPEPVVEAAPEASVTNAPVSQIEPPPQLDRRAPSPSSIEQARNLELRLSHLEHTLEDSRRFITARVVRELKGLHHSIKRELLDVVSTRPPEPEVVTARPVEPKGSGWSFLAVILLLVTIGMILFYAGKFSDMVVQSQRQQGEMAQQLVGLRQSSLAAVAKTVAPAEVPGKPEPVAQQPGSDYLADLAWAYNQTATISFTQNNIDPRVAIRLQELLSRIIANGFRGNVTVTAYAGNFCLAIDTAGQPQLPGAGATMANCLFANEIYGLEQLAKHYVADLEAVLAGLTPAEKAAINLQTRVAPGNYPYPDRQSTTPRDWNAAALANNRLELRLESSGGEK